MALDLIVKGGMVIDGSGTRQAYRADVGVHEGVIRKIGNLKGESAREVLNAEGLVVAPGFVDIQNHSDSYGALLRDRTLESMLAQGITSILVGHCGSSLAPLLRGSLASIQKWTDVSGLNVNWRSMEEFASELSLKGLGVNVGTLVGHATLRREFTREEVRAVQGRELSQMKNVLARSMREGAWGVSIGLEYAHGRASEEKELLLLLSEVAQKKGFASFHLRDEGSEVIGALQEALYLTKKSGVRAKIAHFKMRLEENVEYATHALETFEMAQKDGINFLFDIYPYTRLNFGIIFAAETGFALGSIKLVNKSFQGPFKVGHGNMLPDCYPLILKKHVVIAGVGIFVAIRFAGENKTIGRLVVG